MATKPFVYQDPYPLGADKTGYRKVAGSEKYVSITSFEGNEILKVDPEALTVVANEAMRDVSFLLRPEHNESVGRILRRSGGIAERQGRGSGVPAQRRDFRPIRTPGMPGHRHGDHHRQERAAGLDRREG